MKKTTVRFAAVGTVLLLGAGAMALAQHDARERPPETLSTARSSSQTPQPILVDDVEPAWIASSGNSQLVSSLTRAPDPVVRANEDAPSAAPPSLSYQPEPSADSDPSSGNPLRPLASLPVSSDQAQPLGSSDDGSMVELAAGEGPAGLATLPALPPGLAASPLAEAGLPASAGRSSAATPPMIAELPGAPGAPADGQLPTVAPLMSNAPPGWVNSGPAGTRQSLSDTGRPAMPPTDLSSAGVREAGQAWLQAPAELAPSATLGTPRPTGLPSPLEQSATAPPASGPGGMLPEAGPSSNPSSSIPPRSSVTPPSSLPPSIAPSLGERTSMPLPPMSATGTMPAAGTMPATGTSSRALQEAPSARSLLAGSALGSLISNQPGNRHLDGSQNPIMLIQKRMAGECQVGKRTTVLITVRNAGNSAAQDVEVVDSVPSGATFAESMPAVTPTAEGVLVWKLGEMAPGDERTINLQIIPDRQGELGSTAVVRFAAQASVRTLATLPKLELTQSAPPEVLIGSPHAIDVVVKNVGSGVARGVRLEADLPANVRHETGDASLEASFGELAPNESKHIRLESMAVEPGPGVCAIRALTEDGVQQMVKVDLRVLAPALQASITGPSKRYLDRQAKFEVMIQNTGTAPATNCEFVMRLPAGLNFNTANNAGTYDPKQHAVFWSVPEFPAGHAEPVELTVLPVEVGPQTMAFQGSADLGVKVEARGGLTVEEQGELAFRIEQDADPIEVNASTTFTIEVRNVGRADHNVQLAVQLPSGSRALKVEAPVKYSVLSDQLVFEPIPQMDSRAVQKFRIEVGNLQVGTQIVRAQLKSQNRPTPVIKEEATDVYNDRD